MYSQSSCLFVGWVALSIVRSNKNKTCLTHVFTVESWPTCWKDNTCEPPDTVIHPLSSSTLHWLLYHKAHTCSEATTKDVLSVPPVPRKAINYIINQHKICAWYQNNNPQFCCLNSRYQKGAQLRCSGHIPWVYAWMSASHNWSRFSAQLSWNGCFERQRLHRSYNGDASKAVALEDCRQFNRLHSFITSFIHSLHSFNAIC